MTLPAASGAEFVVVACHALQPADEVGQDASEVLDGFLRRIRAVLDPEGARLHREDEHDPVRLTDGPMLGDACRILFDASASQIFDDEDVELRARRLLHLPGHPLEVGRILLRECPEICRGIVRHCRGLR